MPSDQVLRLPAPLATVEHSPPPAEQKPCYINAERPKVRKLSIKERRSNREKQRRRGPGGRFLANVRVGMAMTSSFNGIEELEVNNQIAKRIRAC